MTARSIHRLGWAAIALLWAATGYLVAYYAVLLVVGPDTLYRVLGEATYNALIPAGGFALVIMVVAVASCWIAPFLVSFSLARRALARLSRPRALWVPLGCAAAATFALPVLAFDGWPGALLPIVIEDGTAFALGYSAIEFLSIRTGMTAEDVVHRLGQPLVRWPADSDGEAVWAWSRSPHGSSYRVRSVVFRAGRVATTYSEFYID